MKNQLIKVSSLALLITLVTACGGDGDSKPADANGVNVTNEGGGGVFTNDNEAAYTVSFTNLTYNQPMGPAAIILHAPGYNAFIDGQAASIAIEMLAESGSPDMLLDDASTSASYLSSMSSNGPTPPRAISSTATLSVPLLDVSDIQLSFATMLVNTNDAFTALNAIDISNMTVGQSTSFMSPTWDSGTEANLETAATIPGPIGGGEAAGFDAARDDLFDRVHFHGGVVTNANATDASLEGLSTSILDETHRWNNPTAKITITRTR